MTDPLLAIRPARPDDAAALRRLAELDSARTLRGDVLLAEADGVPVAAISLYTGAVTADPFRRTAAAIHLLRRRRDLLLRQRDEAAPARRVANPTAIERPAHLAGAGANIKVS